ncbi:MAG: hypothetical protein Aurels2KO_36850 [Aureliella sp.]
MVLACAANDSELRAQQLKLSNSQIRSLEQEGDRLVDQRQYKAALEKYTLAYTGVVARIRGQLFSRPVTPSILNRESLRSEMKEIMDREMTPEDIAELEGTLKVFGFVPASDAPAELYANLLTEQVAGFYDPDDKRMVLIIEDAPEEEPGWLEKLLGGDPFNKDEQKTTLVHELTHALQDQLYDLNAMEDRIEDDDDMSLAFSALVEGDATLLMFAETQGEIQISQMDPAAMRQTFNIMSWLMPLSAGESYRKAPPIFRETLMFPYFQGMLFVLSQGTKQGWPGVDAFYQSPPLSTEQILHPKKYEPGPSYDAPMKIVTPELAAVAGDSWTSLGSSCLGELQTRILLAKVPGGKQAALGWDGDRYEVFHSEDDSNERFALTWVSIWDSPTDAEQFAECYRTYRGLGDDRHASDDQPSWIHAGDGVFRDDSICKLVVDGSKCFVVDGFSSQVSGGLLASLRKSTFSEKTFPKPKPDRVESPQMSASAK